MVNTRGSVNPWSSNDTLLGIQLGDPQSGLVLARRHGLLPHCGLEDSYSDYSRHVKLSVRVCVPILGIRCTTSVQDHPQSCFVTRPAWMYREEDDLAGFRMGEG